MSRAKPKGPKFMVGQVVRWLGQNNRSFYDVIVRIGEPQPGNYVYFTGRDQFPINWQQAIPLTRREIGPREKGA